MDREKSQTKNAKNKSAAEITTTAKRRKAAVEKTYNSPALEVGGCVRKERTSLYYEIWGIVWIALGLLFAVGLYFIEKSAFGAIISTVVFGLLGVVGYIVPLAFIGLGVVSIAVEQKNALNKPVIFICIFLLSVLTVINVNGFSVDTKLFSYYGNAYVISNSTHGYGGLLGAIFAYPLERFLGTVCSNILLFAVMIICIIVVTGFSIKAACKKIADNVRERKMFSDDDDYDDDDIEFDNTLSELERERQAFDGNTKRSKNKREESNRKGYNFVIEDTPIKDVNEDNMVDLDVDLHSINNDASSQPIIVKSKDVNKEQQLMSNELEAQKAGNTAEADIELLQPQRAKEREQLAQMQQNCIVAQEGSNLLVYQRPPYTLLKFPAASANKNSSEMPELKAKKLLQTLASFKISAQITNIAVGPTITRFELLPAQGVRVRRITELGDDLALALAAGKLRIEAPIPGKSAIGIEVPNSKISTVFLREIIESIEFRNSRSPLTIALGKDITGKITVADLAKMPHLLIAGRTGSGKSVCLNSILLSMVYKSSPEDLRLILIDPKVVEFRSYAKLPHLLVPVVTDKKKAAGALRWAVSEMERRNVELAKFGARDIARYNSLQTNSDNKLPRIVVIIDELAELMMTAAKEVEDSIVRLSQLGRACGIHLIVATQRPSVDIITAVIKANIAARIAFAVTDTTNSKVILDFVGAEKLLGNGDMLYHSNETPKPVRIQCAYVSDEEVESVMEFFERTQITPGFDAVIDNQIAAGVGSTGVTSGMSIPSDDSDEQSYFDAIRLVVETKRASASFLQQRLRIGYNRASRIIEELEKNGIVSSFDGSKPRKVLMTPEAYNQSYGKNSPISLEN